ncbi:hypothetical protein D3C87_1427300 [compost metagenome]
MKKILAFLFVFVFMACSQEFAFYKPNTSLEHYQKIENNKELFSRFNNREVEITGVFNIDFENLYLNIEERKVWLEFNSFDELQAVDGSVLDGAKLKTFNNKKVKIKGRFELGQTGHLGAYDSRIIDIVFFGSPD